ncbi:MAG: hypothetical protein IB618_01685 [Candidatus Pacearchaeota archaeon]|nr:MAG: hypothetical protein IB618_01685 [Candidatus Pacearchaeota archaeon]
MRKKDKKGISPVVATVLLIVVAIALFLLIFMWLRGFQKEAITKDGTPIELVCNEINFDISYNSVIETLQVVNMGDYPIHRAEIYRVTETSTTKLGDISGITPGTTGIISGIACMEQIKVIPVLLGITKSGAQEEYVCENQAQTISC